jgi:hypothetical protein
MGKQMPFLFTERKRHMKYIALILSALIGSYSLVLAQGNPSGRGAVTGDPAASSANPQAASPGDPSNKLSNPSGSGSSTSGGKDANGDQGRDKMPESNMKVEPKGPHGK